MRPNRTRPPLEPIISECTLERVQIDLVDMRHQSDGQYKWILHIKDHFSKYSCLCPLKSKQAEEVASNISLFIGAFRPPRILQCDNGREFKGVLLVLLRAHGIKVINDCPRTPRTQGLVEQGNHTMKLKLAAWKADVQRAGGDYSIWADILPKIAFSMSRQLHESLGGKVPYELVFNRAPRWMKSVDYTEQANYPFGGYYR